MINLAVPKINTIIPEPKVKRPRYTVLIEKRYPKVKTDEHKLFGTKPNHKYY